MHRAILQIDLRLNSDYGRYPEPGRFLDRIVDEGRLARSMAATEHENPAEASPDDFQKVIDSGPLAVSVQQEPLRSAPPAWHEDPAIR